MFKTLQMHSIPNDKLPSIAVSHIKYHWLPIRRIRLHEVETNKRLDLTEQEALSVADQLLMHSTYWAHVATEYHYNLPRELRDKICIPRKLRNKICMPHTLRIKTESGDLSVLLYIPPKHSIPDSAEIKKNKQQFVFDQHRALQISEAIYNILGPSVWVTNYQQRKIHIDISETDIYVRFHT